MSTKELAIATSTVWVVIAAVLVMFMQAFAFLEAGLTRMKNVGHIAAKNVLIPSLRSSTTSSASGSRSATAAAGSLADLALFRRSTTC